MLKINKPFQKIFILILIIVFLIAFSGSYKAFSIDNIAFLIALGVDTSDNNNYQLTFQFTKPATAGESGSSEPSEAITYAVNASSIGNGINILNSYIGKNINLSHCKIVVFSEEIARRGIYDEIYTLTNDIELRPSSNIVISKCTANEYINKSKPTFENLLPNYYETFPNSSQFAGYTTNTTLGEFFNSLVCISCEPYAILGSVNSGSSQAPTTINSQKDANIKADSSPLEGNDISENTGMAVFKNDILVGELNGLETLCFLIIQNKVDEFLVSVPNPREENSYLDIYMYPKANTKVDVSIINGSPYIKLKLKLEGHVYSIGKNTNYLDLNYLNEISSYCESYLESNISNLLYKTSKDFKSDINSFGYSAKSQFLTLKDFEDYSWNYKYKDAVFDIDVQSNVKSSFLLNQI